MAAATSAISSSNQSANAGQLEPANPTSNQIVKQKPGEVIYITTYKRGYMVGHFNWLGTSDFSQALQKVRIFCQAKHMLHIHTVPFLIDLDADIAQLSALIGSHYTETE